MQMSTVLRSAIVLGLLGSSSAQAALTQPNAGTNGGGSLFVTVFDTVTFESFTTNLGLLYTDFVNNTAANVNTIRPSAFTALSYDLDMSVFADNNPTNLLFNVYAGDSLGGNGSKGQIVTAQATPTSNNGNMNGVNTAAAGMTTTINQNCGDATGCAGSFGAPNLWGSLLNGQFTVGSGAALDTPIAFYLVAGANTLSSTALTTPTLFADASGDWNWLLAADGTLTFSAGDPVPLPAAVWLLLSGLAGIGAIGRRSSQKA